MQFLLELSHVIREIFVVNQDNEDEYVHEIVQNLDVFKMKCFLQNFSCFFDVELVFDEILTVLDTSSYLEVNIFYPHLIKFLSLP